MATKQHERTLQMMENFIFLHNEGYSIKEIADTYKLSESTVYKRLDEIAAKTGVPRSELLKKPFEADHSGRHFTPVKPIDKAKFGENIDSLILELEFLQMSIERTIDDIDTMSYLMKEDME